MPALPSQVTNCTAGVQQAAIPAQAAALAGGVAQQLTFDVYMQSNQGNNNSCVVTAYDSQVLDHTRHPVNASGFTVPALTSRQRSSAGRLYGASRLASGCTP